MRQKIDLLNGPVFSSLTKLALPIMATSLVQMAYNLTDMIWIGRISSDAVASVGAAGMYMWFANGIASLAKMGGQVKVGHALGAREDEKAVSYARNAIQLALFFGLLYGFLSIVFQVPLIGFFRLNSPAVIGKSDNKGCHILHIRKLRTFFSLCNCSVGIYIDYGVSLYNFRLNF